MIFISYAQNFEDVMLNRAFKNIDCGFYIDVGANDPISDSVTKSFYSRGWRGINIEPLPTHWNDLMHDRPEDINLQCAAGDFSGTIKIWEPDIRGWATASAEVWQSHQAEGHEGVFHETPIFTLKDICEKYVTKEINFLKIDVEGFEESVIKGMDFSRFRPWIILIEATKPNTKIENKEFWEKIILDSGYFSAYSDGLNKFYISESHADLAVFFKDPPNVFDKFIRADHLESRLKVQQAEKHATELEAQLSTTQERVTAFDLQLTDAKSRLQEQQIRIAELAASTYHWEQQASTLEAERNALRQSASWRITAPLRWAGSLALHPMTTARTSANQVIRHSIDTFQQPLSRLMAAVLRRPQLSYRINRMLMRYPALHQQLLNVAHRSGVVACTATSSAHTAQTGRQAAPELASLGPRARQIYADLQTAIEKNQRIN